MAPNPSPMPSPARKTSGSGRPCAWLARWAVRNAEIPSTDPTDRSTFRLITTIVSPSASSAKIVASTSTNWMLVMDRKRGWIAAVIATNTIRTATMPNSRTRNTRSASRRELADAGLPGSRGGASVAVIGLPPRAGRSPPP